MDPDPRALDLETDPAPELQAQPPRRRHARGVVGLPARMALLTLLAVGVCACATYLFAGHHIDQVASERAVETAMTSVADVAGQISELDFVAESDADDVAPPADPRLRQATGAEMLDLLVGADERRIDAVMFVRSEDGELRAVHASEGASQRQLERVAADAFETGAEQGILVTEGRDHVRIGWPVSFGDGTTGGVVAMRIDAGNTLADAVDARRNLLLGILVGASLLCLTFLLLLRRELFRPLEQLRSVMAQIRSGAKGVRIGWSRRDELGLVASEFDSMVAQLEEAQQELARFVNRDPLTGLLTAAAFTDRFSAELTRARREGYPITLLAIDIDDLDAINRTHDRAAGDQVLAGVGEVISSCTRPTDASGRTGDDSFHVALIGADASRAAVVIERIRGELAARVGVGPEQTRVTCGFGVAEYPTHSVDQIALERMATAACTQAQRAGRDRAVAFGPAGGYVDARSLVPADLPAQAPDGERELASTVHALARSLDGIDPVLGGGAHSQRVARYAVAVARELRFSDSELSDLRSAAVLHDVGKVAVPPAILRMAEEELDERQRGALRYHAWVARTMINGAGLSRVADIVFHVPERWDGTGFPERAREDAIPIASRVLRAAELLDELTAPATDASALSPMRAASELKRRAGTELDPDVAIRLARLVREEGLCDLAADEPGDDAELADAA